jgi:hypothetical protein
MNGKKLSQINPNAMIEKQVKTHIEKLCIADPYEINEMYIERNGEIYSYHCKRGTSIMENYHRGIRTILSGTSAGTDHSNRIENTDNFNTSAALLMSLRTVGLYGRGTVQKGSKNFSKYVILLVNKEVARGEMIVAFNKSNKIVATSWMDGSIVNMLSNADSSGVGTVTRKIQQEKVPFKAPIVVKEYNVSMQGVGRLDQLRSRFSICDGHSLKMWHKKLAMVFIDIARVNAYITRKLVMESEKEKDLLQTRDSHRFFMLELIGDLLNKRWMNAMDSQTLMVGMVEGVPGVPGLTPKKPPRINARGCHFQAAISFLDLRRTFAQDVAQETGNGVY